MNISDYIINALSAIIAIEYMDYGFRKKYRGIRRAVYFAAGCVIYFLIVTILNGLIPFEGVLGFLYVGAVICYALFALRGEWQNFVIAGLLWGLILLVSSYGILGVIGLIADQRMEQIFPLEDNLRLYASVIALIVKYSMGKMAAFVFREEESFHKKENGIVAAAFFLLTLLAMGMFYLELGAPSGREREWLILAVTAAETGTVIILVELYHRLGKMQRQKMEQQYWRELEEDRQRALADIYGISREINHWRHDMQGSLNVLYRLQKNKKYDQVEAYLEEMYGDFQNYPELPQPTGNEGLDAVLIKTIAKCRERKIPFSYVVLGKPAGVDSLALGNLMDNLLTNCIEAALKRSGEREIELAVRQLEGELEIQLESRTEESVLERNPGFRSDKGDKMRHGFGMESIHRVIEEYGGTYECWEEEDYFCQRIFLRDGSGRNSTDDAQGMASDSETIV